MRIGSATVPLVKIIRFFIFPIAQPLAWCLDKALGRELASTYSSAEMLKLLQIHVQENIIDQETAGAMTGALTYKVIANNCADASASFKRFGGTNFFADYFFFRIWTRILRSKMS